MFAFIDPLLLPLHHLIGATAQWLPMPVVIVLLTVLVRMALHPLSRATYRATLHRQRLAPLVQQFRDQHGKDPQRLQRETLELHQREGISPAAGCLPSLIQVPVFGVIYRLFSAPLIAGQANVLLHHTLHGVPMTAHVLTTAAGTWVFGMLILLALVIAVLTARQTRAFLPVPSTGAGPQSEVAATMSRIVPWLSFGSVFAVVVMPLGTGLYLVTSALWTFLERHAVRRMVTV